jgi:predicted O-linked N-acetylglucosamine transferase (SPINDLY family)
MSSQGSVFARAQASERAGELDQAARLYEQIVRGDPQHASAWHQLGMVWQRQDRVALAAECLSRAVSLEPENPTYQSDLGTCWHELGRLDEAVDCFQQALELAPDQPGAHYRLGLVLQQRGDQVGASLRFQQAVRLNPDFAEAWNDLAIAHQSLGRLDQAADCFEHVVALAPRLAGARFNLGNVRLAQEKLAEAVACYAAALELQPRSAEALNNMGTALFRLGRLDSARQTYQGALAVRPGFADALNNLGALLKLFGRNAEAEHVLRQVLAADPRSTAALTNLAGILESRLRLDEAESCLRQALTLNPELVNALGNLGNILATEGRLPEAADCYSRACALQPNLLRLEAHAATMLPSVYESADELRRCRAALEANVSRLLAQRARFDPEREPVPVNFLTAYQGFDDRELAQRLAGLCRGPNVAFEDRADHQSGPAGPHFVLPASGAQRGAAPTVTWASSSVEAKARLRIGFLSKHLRDHTIGDLTKGLIRNLSRRAFDVSVFLIGDAADETVSLLRRCSDRLINLPEHIPTARRLVGEVRLDVLVYPDIGMEPVSSALAFSRLAGVQCAMWGHPVTTGIPTIDYFLSSELVEPAGAAEHYCERLVRLKSLPTYYYRPELEIDGAAGAAGSLPGDTIAALRREFGLEQDAHLYLCPQSLFKFHPDFDALLRNILERDPAGRIVLIEAPHKQWNDVLRKRFATSLRSLADRVIFLPRVDRRVFLRLVATADLLLDPVHFGGGNTSFQALGLGVPIVTLPGEFLRGRVTAGCYKKMGLETCVAATAGNYVDLAVRLGTDPQFNARVREEINARSAALFEDTAAVRELEAFFVEACAQTGVSTNRSSDKFLRAV